MHKRCEERNNETPKYGSCKTMFGTTWSRLKIKTKTDHTLVHIISHEFECLRCGAGVAGPTAMQAHKTKYTPFDPTNEA
jgi:hypothetical protein